METKNAAKKAVYIALLKKYALILFGSCIYSLGIALFLDPFNLAAGGVTGLAIILRHFFKDYAPYLSTGIIIIIFNIPLFILGAIYFGKYFLISTGISTTISSLLISLWSIVLKPFIPLTDNILLASIFGGALYGLGFGIIFKTGSTTGGTDIIIKILRKRFRHVRTGMISICVDFAVVSLSAVVFRGNVDLVCYTILSILVFSNMLDWVLYGGSPARLAYVITTEDKAKPICDKILTELDITATLVDGKGAYSGNDRSVIMCAIKNYLFPKLNDVVREIDPHAFTIVTSALEIYGEGYKNRSDEEL